MTTNNGVNALTHQIENLNVNENMPRPSHASYIHALYISLREQFNLQPKQYFHLMVKICQSLNLQTVAFMQEIWSHQLLYDLVQIIKNKLVSPALWVALNEEYNDRHTIDRLKNSICSCVFVTTIIWWTLSHSATPRRTGSRLRKSNNNFYISLRHLYITYYLNEIPNQVAYSHNSAETNIVRNFLTGLQSEIIE